MQAGGTCRAAFVKPSLPRSGVSPDVGWTAAHAGASSPGRDLRYEMLIDHDLDLLPGEPLEGEAHGDLLPGVEGAVLGASGELDHGVAGRMDGHSLVLA